MSTEMSDIEKAYNEFKEADYLKHGSQQTYFRGGYVKGEEAERARSKILEEALEYYEGEGDHRTYLDIFDLIEVKGSVTSFDSEKFSKPATEALAKYRSSHES